MKQTLKFALYSVFAALLLSSCQSDESNNEQASSDEMALTFAAVYPEATRVADNDFESGDKIGVYVAQTNTTLEISGNAINNEPLTYNGKTWKPNYTLYWDKGTYNVYAYYPYMQTISSIGDLPFSVQTDQEGDGYEQSDFLYAKNNSIAASNTPVKLWFKHIMSKLTIRLVKGEDYEGELPDDATVYVHNTYPESTIDLSAGVATVSSRSSRTTITAHNDGNHRYSAIIIPQRISSRMSLIEVEVNGVAYLYESTFLFKPGINHFVNLVISSNPDQVKIDIGGEVQTW